MTWRRDRLSLMRIWRMVCKSSIYLEADQDEFDEEVDGDELDEESTTEE